MNDLATLKSLSAIRPIATLYRSDPKVVPFNRVMVERVNPYPIGSGLVLTVAADAHVGVLDFEDYFDKPVGIVAVSRKFSPKMIASLRVPRTQAPGNTAIVLGDSKVYFNFHEARWMNQRFPLAAVQSFFVQLRAAYCMMREVGQTKVDLVLYMGTVKYHFTTMQFVEQILYMMAYTFYRDTTEL